jgi:gluconate 5-dehydrogenase
LDRLSGKVALITGCSPNIGGAAALGFAREGAKVACNDLRPEIAEMAAESIRKEGGEAIAVPGDVTDEAQVQAMVNTTLETWGKIDVLFSNAVMWSTGGVLDMPTDVFLKALQVINGGAFLMTKYVARSMIEREIAGSIIVTFSTAAWQGQPGNVAYCTGKSGLINFVRSTAMELAGYGIRVNGFTPTATARSELASQHRGPSLRTETDRRFKTDFQALIPMRRLPTPDDYVPALVYLASDESALMTGSHMNVDSGALARYWPWIPDDE